MSYPKRQNGSGKTLSPAMAETIETIKFLFYGALIFLTLRVLIFQPFTIPSESMVPLLHKGDYIIVTKFDYGYSHHSIPFSPPLFKGRILERQPKRGDVVVFKLPRDGRTDYIKRLIGLPGDHIVVQDDHVFVNGEAMPVRVDGIYEGRGQAAARNANARIGTEQLGKVEHRVLFQNNRPSRDYDQVVPEGHYFFMGDNRDNSRDSRFPEVGFVPERNLVGKAVRIWLNWDWPDAPVWSRIGDPIH
jgi:signal peptidase I